MLPIEATIAMVEHELKAARAWAVRRGVSLEWCPEILELRATLPQPKSSDTFYLRGRFENYREEAPAWIFCGPDWGDNIEKRFFPRPGPAMPFGSMLHSQPVLCAPFNRLAYKQYQGPHSDWGGPAQWITPKGGSIYAVTIGDMLQAIVRDVHYCEGRMQ